MVFQLCFRVCNQEVSDKPGWLEIKWYTSAFPYADDVNTLGESVQTIRENTEPLLVASKETGLEVNADKTKYIVRSRDQNAGGSHKD